MEKQLQPKLRFPEFSENWNEYSFKDIFTFTTGKNIKQKEASPEFKIPCVRYGELYYMYNEVITKTINYTNLDESDLKFSEGDEIILPSAGEDPMDIGSASALTVKNVAIGRTINILKPKVKDVYSSIFASYYINQKLKVKISTLAKGVSISNVYNTDLQTLFIKLPSLPEQQKIADYLTTIDKKIELLTEKKTELSRYKKAMMQKLFAQEIRFKDENGIDYPEWEEKRLNVIVDVRDGTHDSPKYISKSKYFMITSKNLNTNGSLDFNDIKYLKEEDYTKINQRSKVEENDILFGMIGTIGNPVIVKGEINFAIKNMALLKKSELVNTMFLYQLFRSSYIEKIFKKINTGNTQKFISLSQIRNLEIPYPSLPEQQKIANFLSVIDESITKVEEQIKETQNFKKAMLQQMFV